MIQRELVLALPDALAHEAEEAGLLNAQAIETLLREAIRRRRVERLFEAMERLSVVSPKPLTAAEVEAEIEAVRAARRYGSAASG